MTVRLHTEPRLENPVLVAGWPGIGNIGIIAVDTLKGMTQAEEFGEIEPWDFFYPRKVLIRDGELKDLEFPTSKFYFKRTANRDLIFFIGEEQPLGGGGVYAEGDKAYEMANLVLDIALRFGCQKVYTSGAAVSPIHHTMKPRVWAVPNTARLIPEIRRYENTVLMSDIEERGGQGTITGLNGLLLGVARKRGLEAVCFMGEIPIYLQGFHLPYPKASKSVLEVLTAALRISIPTTELSTFIERTDGEIERLYENFPPEIRQQLEKLRYVTHTKAQSQEPGPITEEDKRGILENIDKFFKKEPKGD
ncbi:MAG: PAC2 family protein [Chloroflexi bacterium]|nr:PAC2 family protein [Chloroflexota bacterium]